MHAAYGNICFLYRHCLNRQVETIPDDVKELFDEYSIKQKNLMQLSELQEFLIKKQGVARDKADKVAKTIIKQRTLKGFKNFCRDGLSQNGFFHYLLSRKQNHPLDEKELDEEASLANYFVYTSHRSYMKRKEDKASLESASGNTSDEKKHNYKKVYTSISAIKKALQNGVRVIELDLKPNSDYSNIKLYHQGKTKQSLTPVTLRTCLEAINETAFVNSDFPVILILVEHFGSAPPDKVPHLRKKIEELIESAFDSHKLCSSETPFKDHLKTLKNKIIILKKQTKQEQSSTDTTDNSKHIAGHIEVLEGEIHNFLKSDPNKFRICSLTESHLEKFGSSDVIISSASNFTKNNLLVVYPNSNTDEPEFSPNYDPLTGWTCGAQMVAFNMQDFGKYLWVMQGLFRSQGHTTPTGYVKKPDILLEQDFDPRAWRPVKKILKVKVYLGTGWRLDFDNEDFDVSSPPDFFTAVEIVGVPADEAREKTVPAINQWVPVWDKEFTFPLTVPDLAMLVIEVSEFDTDRTHDFGGQTCLPVSRLRDGIRSVPLYNKKGERYRSAKLLMRFSTITS